LATFLDSWKCRFSKTATECLKVLGQELHEKGSISGSNAEIISEQLLENDLRHVLTRIKVLARLKAYTRSKVLARLNAML
jgi:hypothetical protein